MITDTIKKPFVRETVPSNYYVKTYRVAEKGKRTYSKIVTKEKADRLLNGIKTVNADGNTIRVPLKRKLVRA